MTFGKALEDFDSRRENSLSLDIKAAWLSELDMKINAELLSHYGEGGLFEGYSHETPAQTELSAPNEYGEIYFLYLVMQDDFLNAEIARYNNSARVFNSLYAEMADFINRTNRVKNPGQLKAGGLYE